MSRCNAPLLNPFAMFVVVVRVVYQSCVESVVVGGKREYRLTIGRSQVEGRPKVSLDPGKLGDVANTKGCLAKGGSRKIVRYSNRSVQLEPTD